MSKHKTLLMLATLYPLYTWADTDADFCEGAGLLAQFGAISRIEHYSVEQIDRAVTDRAENLDQAQLRVARYYSAMGYHSELSPDAVFTLAEAHCVEAMHHMFSKRPRTNRSSGGRYE